MKSFKHIKKDLNEAAPQQPQQQPNVSDSNDAKKQAAVTTQRFRAAAMKAKVPYGQAKRAYDQLQKLSQQRPNVPVNRLMSTLSGGKHLAALQNKFPLDALNADQQTYMRAYRNINALEEQSDASNPPAVLNLRRTGMRVFPDGRKVALYVNKQLGLVFSVPYAGTGQTPGEIIPTLQVQATNEEVEQIEEKIDKKQELLDALDRHTELAVRANKLGDDEVVKVHQKYINKIKTKLGKIAATNEEIDAEDKGEYDYEGDMAISQLKSIITHSIRLKDMLEPDTNLPEWVQAKITLAEDYVVTAANYMEGQQDNQGAGDSMDEEVELDEDVNKIVAGVKGTETGNRYEMHTYSPGTKDEWSAIVKTHQNGDSLQNKHGGYGTLRVGKTPYVKKHFDQIKIDEEIELQEGSLKYHLDQAELHDQNQNARLRDYHMSMAQHRVRGMRTPVNPNKRQQTAYENRIEQGRRFSTLRSQFSTKNIHELNIEDESLKDLHSQLNPKNKKILSDLAKTNPRKALEIADKLSKNINQQPQEQNMEIAK